VEIFWSTKVQPSSENNVLKVMKNGVFAPDDHIITFFNSPKLLKSQEKGP
jgi:hypothetical protein